MSTSTKCATAAVGEPPDDPDQVEVFTHTTAVAVRDSDDLPAIRQAIPGAIAFAAEDAEAARDSTINLDVLVPVHPGAAGDVQAARELRRALGRDARSVKLVEMNGSPGARR